MKIRIPLITLCLAATGMVSCNVFDPLSSPSGDEQLLSAARACFDLGDYACAKENYAKVSADKGDDSKAELAFLILEEQGANMGTFIDAFSGGNGAGGVNKLAAKLSSKMGKDARKALCEAYHTGDAISSAPLKGLVQFISGISLLAEILAESSSTAGQGPAKNDIANRGADCVTQSVCATSTDCNPSSAATAPLPNSETAYDLDADTTCANIQGTLTINMVYDTLLKVLNSLNGLGAGGKLGGGTKGFADIVNSSSLSGFGTIATKDPTSSGLVEFPFARCFRQLLIKQGIGG